MISDGIRMLPQAADGTVFNRALRQVRGFQIGRKGDEFFVGSFDEALRKLGQMESSEDRAYFRRPSATSGRYGIVRVVRWVACG